MWALAAVLACAFSLTADANALGSQSHQLRSDRLVAGGAVSHSPDVASAVDLSPISAPMHCIMVLAVQFLALYVALAMIRTYAYASLRKWESVPAHRIFQDCSSTMNHAPMLAALFIAYRMRVLFLTQGGNEMDGSVTACMYLSTYALTGANLCVMAVGWFTRLWFGVGALVFTGVKFLLLSLVYGGAIGVIYGIVTYSPPSGIWPGDAAPGLTASSKCVCIVACQFFFVYFLTQVLRTHAQISGKITTKIEAAVLSATNAMNLAPMLAILFTALRMRSWQVDAKVGRPQEWAQITFFACTVCLPVQTFLAFLVPYLMPAERRTSDREEDAVEQPQNFRLLLGIIVARLAVMAWLYAGLGYITYCVVSIISPRGPEFTEPISVTQQCVINLTWQFLMVYFVVSVAQAAHEAYSPLPTIVAQTLESSKATAGLSPMLAVLFIALRMRSLTMTHAQGAPQLWAQDAMYGSIWLLAAMIILGFLSLCTTKLPGGKGEARVSGQEMLFYSVEAIRYLLLLVLCGAICAVIVAAAVMTPETAVGRGSAGLVGPDDKAIAEASL